MNRFFTSRKERQSEAPDAAPDGPIVPDPEALFADLARTHEHGPYNGADRRRDFRRVFLDSQAGKRVLYELFAWSHMFSSTFVPGDSYATHWREGGRDIGLRILTVLDTARPKRAAPGAEEEIGT